MSSKILTKTKAENSSTSKGKKRSLPNASVRKSETDPIPEKKFKLTKNEEHAAQRIKTKINKETKSSAEYNSNTIYVGNIPINTTKKQLKIFFKKHGTIQSIRIRGIAVSDPSTPKRVAAIKKEFHPNRKSAFAYIKFSTQDEATKAECENGQLFENFHLRVTSCNSKTDPDESKAIFVGNLNFDVEEEELWKLFSSCGPISHVRVIRDGLTGIGKGFAYINFKDKDAVFLALEMGEVSLRNRVLRISSSNLNRAKKTKKSKLKTKNNKENGATDSNDKKSKVQFAGKKFDSKKKNKKPSTFAMKKKKLAEKLMSKGKGKMTQKVSSNEK